MPCWCPGTTGGASCMHFRRSRWSLKSCRRSFSLQVFRWFWSLLCRKQLPGSQNIWICPKRIPSHCSSKVSHCWLRTSFCPMGGQRLITTGRQIYTHGDFVGHPCGEGPFPGGCSDDVKGPSRIITAGRDLCPSVGQKDGMCSESEAIISVPTWCTCSETDYSRRLSFHIARLWLLCYIIGLTIWQPTHTSSFSSELFSWNVRCNAESCPSGTFILCLWLWWVRFGGQWSSRIIWWRHSTKMADHENIAPVSIGFGETTFLPSCFECHSRQVCVFERKHPASTDGISVTRSRVSCHEPVTFAGSTMDLRAGYGTSLPIWSRTDALPCQAIEALSTGLGTNPGGQWLFIHWNRSIRDIMRNHISRWIVEAIKEAYTWADREYDRVTTHEVRALSASWAYNCQVALPDILSAAFWRLSGVFQNSYPRNMACIADGMFTLGPVVVAQQVVDPGHLPPP